MSAVPSLLSLLLSADPIVQAVMGCLLVASLAVWSIFAAKLFELRHSHKTMSASLGRLQNADSVASALQSCPAGTVAYAMLEIAKHEVERSQPHLTDGSGTKERLALRLDRAEAAIIRSLQRGTGILGSIGSTSPFIGLFGTVWGIMNSFSGIAASHTSSLAVVAPGIAEALMATATGLIAAIPAVISYNILIRIIGGHKLLVADMSCAIRCLVSLDLERPRKPRSVSAMAEVHHGI